MHEAVIDHVIYGTSDLEHAAKKFSALGLESIEGGEHPAFGTANRVIPLNGCYLELMGISDKTIAKESPLGSWLTESIIDGDRFVAWCLRVNDLDEVSQSHDLVVIPGLRVKPDGTELSWNLAGLDVAMTSGLPFFISWDKEEMHPSRDPVSHRASLAWVEYGGDEEKLMKWVGSDLPIRTASDNRGVSAVGIVLGNTEIEIR